MDIYNVANQMKMERKTIFDMKMRVTFYARVSTTREEQENSIENQIAFFTDMLTVYAASQPRTVQTSCVW